MGSSILLGLKFLIIKIERKTKAMGGSKIIKENLTWQSANISKKIYSSFYHS